MDCYIDLKNLGYNHIAIGGMLIRKENSARYVNIRDESFLRKVLAKIREHDPEGWLFALGCYSPKRHSAFLQYSVFGSDYKGWIFQYSEKSPGRGDVRTQKRRFKEVRLFIEEQVLSRSQEYRAGPRLLIIPCSKRKVEANRPIHAIQLYDGPLYHLIRKYVHDFSNGDGMDIAILSAKYGLITPLKRISPYNQRMTLGRALDLQKSCSECLLEMFSDKNYTHIAVNLGKDYLPALEGALQSLDGVSIERFKGSQGERLRDVKKWILS